MTNRISKERLAGALLFMLVGWAAVSVSLQAYLRMMDLGAPMPPPLAAGTEAPAFELQSLKGETVSLGQFKGRPVLAMFWSAG